MIQEFVLKHGDSNIIGDLHDKSNKLKIIKKLKEL